MSTLNVSAEHLGALHRSGHERIEFMRMLRVLVTANNDLSRAPGEA
jgi:hypothetical protein